MPVVSFRNSRIHQLQNNPWDLVIIGGGITGAGIYVEAVKMGIKTLLVEKNDFASGTSSKSTKMVHGGLRYLKEGEIQLTYDSIRERERLVQKLPGLIKKKSYYLPLFDKGFFGRTVIQMGLMIYDLLAFKKQGRKVSTRELLKIFPLLNREKLKSGFEFTDAVTDDARLVYTLLAEGDTEGGEKLNYCRVKHFSALKDKEEFYTLQLHDRVGENSFAIMAKKIINATGVEVNQFMRDTKQSPEHLVRPLRGSHLILKQSSIPLAKNISFMHPNDERPILVMNWEGRVLVGTTDLDHTEELGIEPQVTQEEVTYLMDGLNQVFPGLELSSGDILSTFSGLRPIIDSKEEDPSKASREHLIWTQEGVVYVSGGKLTTFRLIALEALGQLGFQKKRLVKGQQSPSEKPQLPQGVDPNSWERLTSRFGDKAINIVQKDPNLTKIPHTETSWAELEWSAEKEEVVHLEDLMLRRTRLGLILENGGLDLLPEIKKHCQKKLGWDDALWRKEKNTYITRIHQNYSLPLNG